VYTSLPDKLKCHLWWYTTYLILTEEQSGLNVCTYWHKSDFFSLSCHRCFSCSNSSAFHRSGNHYWQGLGWMWMGKTTLQSASKLFSMAFYDTQAFLFQFFIHGEITLWCLRKCVGWTEQWTLFYMHKLCSLHVTGSKVSVAVVIVWESNLICLLFPILCISYKYDVTHLLILCIEHHNK
jgi:hypothetical protein